MYPASIQRLIDLFSKFPTVGPRTAARFVFYLLRLSPAEIESLTASMKELKESIRTCQFCFNPFDSKEDTLCPICQNPNRDKSLLCVVEKETDLVSIENTKKYKGLYFILGGNVSSLKNDEAKKAKTDELIARLKNPENFGLKNANFKEVIIATNSTTEGEATGLYVERKLKAIEPPALKISHLGRGLPVGGELEYADEETLSSAFEGRK